MQGYLVSLGNGQLNGGDTIQGILFTFNAAATSGAGTWTWSGTSAGGATVTNQVANGTYYVGTDGSVYFVPTTAVGSVTSATATTTPVYDDNIYGTAGNDSAILGDGNSDYHYGGTTSSATGTGNDTISAGAGNDTVFGGDGDDLIRGGGDNDSISGGDGNDTIYGDDQTPVTGSAETLTWVAQGRTDETSVAGGFTSDTGGMRVTFAYNDDGAGTGATIDTVTQYNGAGVSTTSGLRLNGNGTGNTSRVGFTFDAEPGSGLADQVSNVQFRINDIDWARGNHRDVMTIRAWDANGNMVVITLTRSGNDTVVNGTTTAGATITANNSEDTAAEAGGSVLVSIPGPVHYIEIDYDNALDGTQAIWLTDVSFTSLPATSADDVIDAGAGDDLTYGGTGNDTIATGTGNDTVYGGTGNDALTGGTGNSSLFGGDGNDTLTGGAGNETLHGDAGNDTTYGGAGNDVIGTYNAEGDGDDTAYGGDGNDAMIGGAGNDALFGDAGDDTLSGGTGTDTLTGGDGQDNFIITEDHALDTIFGGNGGVDNDTIQFANVVTTQGINVGFTGSEAGNYNYIGGGATGTFTDIERISGTDNADTVNAALSGLSQTLFGNGGDDSLTGGSAADVLDGGTGNDSMAGGAGADSLSGGTGNDRLSGDDGNDSLSGGDGNDVLFGGLGNDTLDGGIGDDSLDGGADNDTLDGGAGNDTVSGGTGNDTLTGGAGNDTVFGGDGVDTLTGSVGNDSLYGGLGSDQISVDDTNGTTLVQGGEDAGNLDVDRLNLNASTSGVSVTMTGAEAGSFSFSGSATTGTFTEIEQVQTTGFADTINASTSTGGINVLAGAGNDIVTGGSGADTIDLGTGADTVTGGAGNDVINLGSDANTDIIVVTNGGGADRITNFTAPVANGDGTFTGRDQLNVSGLVDAGGRPVNVLDIVVSNDGSGNAVLTFPNGETLTLIGVAPSALPDFRALMAIGIPGPDGTVSGTAGDDVIDATYDLDPTGDRIDSNDVVIAGHGANDDLVQAGAGNDQVFSGAGNDTVYGGTGNDSLYGGTGNDTLFGDAGDDLLAGGAGNDVLAGGADADTFVVAANEGTDTIDGGNSGTDADNLSFATSTSGVNVSFSGAEAGNFTAGTGSGSFIEIETVTGSAQADTLNASGSTAAVTLFGGAGADTLTGGSAADSVDGGAGSDTLNGGAGNDSLSGGADADTITVGQSDGVDTITGGSTGADFDTLAFDGPTSGANVVFLNNEGGTYSIGSGSGTFADIERVQGTLQADTINASAATASVTISGDAGDDSMAGGSGNDVIDLGTGADTADGGAGNDIIDLGADAQNDLIIFADGDGQDRISNFTPPVFNLGTYTGQDLLNVSGLTDAAGRPVNVYDVTVSTDGSGNAVLTFPNGESLTLVGVSAGQVSSTAQLMAMGIPGPDGTVDGTAGDDLIDAGYQGDPGGDRVDNSDAILPGHGAQDDLILAGAGNDQVFADQGNDTIYGGTGNDLIYAGVGNDTAYGDVGNDVIDGETGNDLIYGGDGADFIVGNVGDDTLHGDAGNDTFFGGDGNDAIFGGADDDVLQGNLGNDTLSGGTGHDNLNGGEGDDSLSGDAGNDQLSGGDGNDVLSGGTGDDTVDGGAGNDSLSAGDGNDFMVGGAGEDSLSGDAGNDQINAGTGNDQVYGGDNQDLLFGEGGNDTVYGGADRDTVFGGLGHDNVYGDAGNDIVSGRYGDDTVYGGTGDDEVFGDLDSTGTGARQFAIFGLGTSGNGGSQTVSGTYGFNGAGGVATLEVVDDDVNFNTSGTDSGVPQTLAYDITIGAQTFTAGTAIVMVSATDIFNQATGQSGRAWLIQIGANPADRFWTYDIPVSNGDQITWSTISTTSAVDYDQLVQADGSTTAIGNDTLFGGDGNDSVYGADGNDTLFGDADNDTVDGGTGNDTLYGGTGNDTLSGGDGNDLISGDAGNDVMTGDGGDDRFVLSNAAGTDTVTGGETTETTGDTLDASAVTTNITLNLSGANPETGTLSSTGINTSFTEIETIILGSGADSVIGSSGADHVSTGLGADTVNGGAGNDVFDLGGTGTGDNAADLLILQDGSDDDTISNFDGPIDNGDGSFTGVDTLDVSNLNDGSGNPVNVADVVVSNDGSGNAVLTFPNGESITLIGVDPSEVTDPRALMAMGIPGTDGTIFGTTGDDVINGGYTGDNDGDRVDSTDSVIPGHGPNDDLIVAGAGNDVVSAGVGNDTVYGGTGNDTIGGGTGNDTLFGDAGNDILAGGAGNDSLSGGADVDRFDVGGNEGTDTISGGETGTDSDTLAFGSPSLGVTVSFTGNEAGTYSLGTGSGVFTQIETISGTAQGDRINASATSSGITLIGGAGGDTMTGGSGADVLFGGADNDILVGGTGADSLSGDTGNDAITFADGDTASGGDGDDLFTLADLGEPSNGTITVVGGEGSETTGDTLQLGTLADWSSLVITTPANVGGGMSGYITLDDGTILNFSEIENIICFTPGTRIATPRGARPVEKLAVGDMVMTRDHGLQPIRWIGKRTVPAIDRFAPVRIRPGVVTGLETDLLVSPQHRMLFQGYRAELLFGCSEVLVAAAHLIDGKLVTQDAGGFVTYIHIMFDDHEIIYAEGAATESFHPGSVGLSAVTAAAREEMFALFPDLRAAPRSYGQTARRVLKAHEGRLIRG